MDENLYTLIIFQMNALLPQDRVIACCWPGQLQNEDRSEERHVGERTEVSL